MDATSFTIGLFDSGVGGLCLLSLLEKALPYARFVYLADISHLPYGNKSKEQLRQYAVQNIEFLIKQKVDFIVIACHTMSCVALEYIQSLFSLPIVGVTLPAISWVAHNYPKTKVALLGTQSMIDSGYYAEKLSLNGWQGELKAFPCPHWVTLIEQGRRGGKEVKKAVATHLEEVDAFSPDLLILGCTHYPLIQKAIAAYVGSRVKILDPAQVCVKEVELLVKKETLSFPPFSSPQPLALYLSAPSSSFSSLALQILGKKRAFFTQVLSPDVFEESIRK